MFVPAPQWSQTVYFIDVTKSVFFAAAVVDANVVVVIAGFLLYS